jgi:cellulose synthase/poly-beta-1,6-N-acetylglucosamine synthase-like glycosyltransferase
MGEFVTVYDAEDDPDPLQLREAVARFRADPDQSLACLQAPLRVRIDDGDKRHALLNRQFAVEYAALFEVTLPGMARLGLPLPLGGTSNHFRVDVLRSIGGWDAWNVTEDADLGFQLWRYGWRSDMLTRPTHEAPPGGIAVWLPQRTRWLKGFMQTLGVHTRDVRGLGAKGCFALVITLAFTLASAALHAVVLAWVAATVLMALATGLAPLTPVFAMTVLATGTVVALATGQIGASRAGVRYTPADMLLSPIYWSLLTLAFGHALWRLIRDPFTWDKTPHRASRALAVPVSLVTAEPEPAGREAA